MDNLGKEFFDMIGEHVGKTAAKWGVRIGFVAFVGTMLGIIYATIIVPVAWAVTGISAAVGAPVGWQGTIRAIADFGTSLIGTGVGVALLIGLHRRFDRRAKSVIEGSTALLNDVQKLQRRIEYFTSRIEAEETQEGKIALIMELMEGQFSLSELPDTQSPQGTEQK